MMMSLFASRKDGCSPPESPNGRVDPQQQLPQELGGYQKSHRAGSLPPVEEHAEALHQEHWPADQTEPGQAARDEPGRVHQVAEEQPVPEGDDESGAEQSRPVLERSEGDG